MSCSLPSILPHLIGHRGAAAHAPENSLAGFSAAHRLGVTWVEVDVRLTGDGRLILLHDDTVDRTTDGNGRAADLSLEVISSFDAGGWFAPEFSGILVPTVEEAIDQALALNLGINFEIKPHAGSEIETGHALADLLDTAWPTTAPPPLLSSFSIDSLVAAKKRAPHLYRGLLVADIPENWQDRVAETGAQALHCHHECLNKDKIAMIRDHGLAALCYTVNDPVRGRHLREWGITSIITDDPVALMRIY